MSDNPEARDDYPDALNPKLDTPADPFAVVVGLVVALGLAGGAALLLV